ncbi:MAG: FHA domain-containing protein [Blastocatellia bacterium]
MAAVICINCRYENLSQAKFCESCGIQLTPKSWVIGSASDCDIVVARPTVSSHHCRLTQANGEFTLEDTESTNGTFVNGVRIEARVKISHMDSITLGRTTPMPWPETDKGTVRLESSKIIQIGRDADNDVVLDYPMISAHHARIVSQNGNHFIEDLGSTNGTSLGSPERRISKTELTLDDTVYFGSFPVPASRLLEKVSLGERPHTSIRFEGASMVLGRDPGCDHPLDHPMISWHHARLLKTNDDYMVEDLNSTNGTFVNGQRISGAVRVNVSDQIRLGSYAFVFTAAGNIEQRDYRGNVTIEAKGVAVEVTRKRKRLIEDVSLTIYPSELVGLMGPAGAGKTTLMNSLNGYTRPAKGTVLINGQDLYQNYDQFCGQIGYMPQDDIMHRDLTVGQALYYAARLRLPSDFTDSDIRARIQHVLSLLEIEGTEDVIIGTPEKKGISGGQRKRVNLAMELLSDPSILFLDEPTSGLAADDALNVMQVLRNLADAGKTIILTIHQPGLDVFRMMDNLVIVSRDKRSQEPGRMVYFGPAYPNAVEFFNPDGIPNAKPNVEPSPDEVLRGLRGASAAEWVARYNASDYKRKYVDERAGKRPSASAEPVARRGMNLSQWWTLVRRNFAIKIQDRWYTAILLAQAPIIALMLVLGFGGTARNESAPGFGKTIATIFLVSISAIWFGCSNAAREVVSEWAIYHRERMVNLKIPSYIASKLAVLGGICFLQCAVLVAIIHGGIGLKVSPLLMLAVLTLASLVGLTLGLTVSSLARTSEVAIGLIPVILIPMVIFGGLLSTLHLEEGAISHVNDPIVSRWAFEALLVSESEARGCWKVLLSEDSQTARPKAKALDVDCITGLLGQSQTSNLKSVDDQIHDMAEGFFPEKIRAGVPACLGVLALMLAALTSATMLILKLRDVH